MISEEWAESATDEIARLQAELDKWKSIATMFYDRHENRRNCSLIASCKECDAYEKVVRGD